MLVTRYGERWRPKVLRPDKTYKGDKSKFGQWTRQIQRGKSNEIRVSVRYWYKFYTGRDGVLRAKIYEIGDTVHFRYLGYDVELIVDQVEYSLTGASHRKCTLTLRAKDTYAPPPLNNVYYDPIDGSADDGTSTAQTQSVEGFHYLNTEGFDSYANRVNAQAGANIEITPDEILTAQNEVWANDPYRIPVSERQQ
jgi:hypothetical protein